MKNAQIVEYKISFFEELIQRGEHVLKERKKLKYIKNIICTFNNCQTGNEKESEKRMKGKIK